MSLPRYEFLSFVRRGAAAELKNKDPLFEPQAPADPTLPYRGTLDATLRVRSSREGRVRSIDPARTTVQLHGPGDVTGVDPRHVIRTEPRHMSTDLEPHLLAAIEFDQPDFLWQFTPAAAAPGSAGAHAEDPHGARVRPWLSLIALKDDEFELAEDRPPDPLPAIRVTLASLPDLVDSWAWAHAQVSGRAEGNDIAATIAKEPARTLSRLLCPRRLEARTHYTAFLVPAFDLGVKAGLGEDLPRPADLAAAAQATAKPAWTVPQEPEQVADREVPRGYDAKFLLPVYYRFEFTTSEEGSFASLARRLEPRELPETVGTRPMAVDRPRWGAARGAGPPLRLTGALRSLSAEESDWSGEDRSNFQEDIAAAVNRASAPLDDPDQDPRVVPPLYGRWHAARSAVDPATAGWPNGLNTDPRLRAMAGFGTEVVLDQRSQLLTSAWAQVAGIEEANQLRRQAQLAREASTQVYEKHLQAAGNGARLCITAPVHARVLASARTTVRAKVARSRLPVSVLSSAFRRLARPLGALRRRQGVRPADAAAIVTRLARGQISPRPPLRPPDGMESLEDRSDRLFPRWLPAWLRPWLRLGPGFLIVLAIAVFVLLALLGLLFGSFLREILIGGLIAVMILLAALLARGKSDRWSAAWLLRVDSITPDLFDRAPPFRDFHLTPPDQPQPPDSPPGQDAPDAAAFRQAGARLAKALAEGRDDPPVPPALDVPALEARVVQRLDPARTVPARVKALHELDPELDWDPEDPLEEVMVHPEFPQPMYEPLRDLSQELLLPGLEAVPPNTLGLLEENHAFIEAYLVGANHEMSRQLLWNRYPTDQRGSFFRQFWDVRSYVRRPGDSDDAKDLGETLKDIPPIHRWPRNEALGTNRNRPVINSSNLVLLVRGDLLRRYPNCVIYACNAVRDGGKRTLGQEERYPLFRGVLSPDLTFLGFALSRGEARGSGGAEGWYFVFQEAPSEARFGLEPEPKPPAAYQVPAVDRWSGLSWANFGPTPDDLGRLRFLSAAAQPSSVTIADEPDKSNKWGTDSAQIAFITLRRPTRIAIHAETMLPSR
jgi:hypothetical protein